MAKAPAKNANKKGFEETLWDTANQLRGSVESSEYKHVVLSLVFLKFITDKFEAKRKQLIANGQEAFVDMDVFYQQDNVFFLPEVARWSYVKARAKQDDIAVIIDTALATIEKSNSALTGALPDNYFSRQGLEVKKLASLIDTIENIDTLASECQLSEEDLVGRVYEYFLGRFAASEGKGGGEFYTPKSVVTLLAEMLEPYEGKIYDPCCGSGGMFVQSLKFVESHQGKSKDIAIYGQELTTTTYKLAKMNLAIRGLIGNLGERPADTFFADQHPDLKADFIMANPPFNLKEWRSESELTDDPRFAGFRTPPTGNANYAWILHMLSKLSVDGTAGFVLANGSMSSNTSGEGEIRQKLIEDDRIECMIALPGQLFYTTQIPVCLWFISKSKQANPRYGYRARSGETLFIDARELGTMVSRTNKELTVADIARIADTFHAWRCSASELKRRVKAGEISISEYQDQAGFCKVATLDEIKANDFVLTPGRYVGAAEVADDGIAFETKMRELTQTLYRQMNEAQALDAAIRANMEALGYGE
ncbi:type I restriction-modification system subunit M [Edwardsiella piscicida]|uniref:class I SAM-dependent DNA methyltransferase n=1 Tax=Edwardsiella piscicida TaxID=1263550 RepID=UPI0002C13F1F|nr:class I SAM-dependent DNA methyltransferase [Edwardsiella piscicida]AGH73965.1 type I restriction-modification system, M subunit [Edwardsiella piscicida C07-087]EKS7780340.1 type I restriction-modification system subunit M [Edwardsiella piscicida]EKS7783381.1 type I restriction-modification system subunit M [Edwardsiella piscicida]UCQ23002.1 type I restriction-modification system subunit M [Edwardsiella piscicida]UCQ33208.1 type I restriction-modification system subunit M [Edwardsiella pisc